MTLLLNFDDGQMSKTEISAKIMKRKKSKFLLSESTKFSAHVQGKVFP